MLKLIPPHFSNIIGDKFLYRKTQENYSTSKEETLLFWPQYKLSTKSNNLKESIVNSIGLHQSQIS